MSETASDRALKKATDFGESLLAHPGREAVDAEAEYKYVARANFVNVPGYEQVSFYKREPDRTWAKIPVSTQFDRSLYVVGVAINPFVFQDSSGSVFARSLKKLGLQKKLAHWALYLREEESDQYRMYGLNFSQETGQLIVESVWGTKEGWKKLVPEGEFQKDENIKELQIYCSLAEFILTTQFFVRYDMKRPQNIWKFNAEFLTHENPGRSYDLLKSNCQHFARGFLDFLVAQGFTDPRRTQEPFSLQKMARKLQELELNQHDAGFTKLEDSMSWDDLGGR